MSLTKNLFSASAKIVLAGVIARSLAILSAPILTKLLGPESYGVFALLSSLMTLGTMVAIVGVDLSYNRFACTGDSQQDRITEIFCWRFVIVTATAVALLFAVSDWLRLYSPGEIQQGLLTLTGLSILLSVTNVMAQTRRQIQAGYSTIAITLVVAAVVATTMNIILAKFWRHDVWAMVVGSLTGLVVTSVMLRMPSPRLLLSGSGLSKTKRKELLRFGFFGAAISAPLYWIISTSDRWFINAYLDHKSVGIYGFCYNIAFIGQMLNSALLVAWRTESVKNYEGDPINAPAVLGRLWTRFVAKLGLAWLLVSSAGGDVIRLLADRQFHDGAAFVPWIAGGVFFYGVSHLASTSLILKKNMRPFTYWYIVSALVSVVLNFIFVPTFGALGAAMVQSISFAIAAAGIMWTSQKIYPLNVNFKQLAIAIPSILLAGIVMSHPWHATALISLGYKLPVGIIVAMAIFYYVAPDWYERLVQRLIQTVSELWRRSIK